MNANAKMSVLARVASSVTSMFGANVRALQLDPAVVTEARACSQDGDPAGTSLRRTRQFTALGLAVFLVLASQSSLAATFSVNSTGDDGDNNSGDGLCFTGLFTDVGGGVFAAACTLRAAIEEANALAGPDVVEFAASLPKTAGFVEIRPDVWPLPPIRDQITIDGYSADGYDLNDPGQHPIVNLSGSSVLPILLSNGLEIVDGSAGTRIQGLAIHNFRSAGIIAGGLVAPLSDITIEGCHLGISRGVFYQGNGTAGIRLQNTQNATVGRSCDATSCSGQRNVIASTEGPGIFLDRARFTLVAGNLVGTDTFGSSTFVSFGGSTPNEGWGIDVRSGTANQIGALPSGGENLVSGNLLGGIRVDETGTSLFNNKVGTNLAGTGALPNLGPGIELAAGPNTVGAVGQGRNLVSGNGSTGIHSVGPNLIVGNVIGLSDDQSTPLGNDGSGIILDGSSALVRANVIGGNDVHGLLAFGDFHSIILNRVGTNHENDDVGNGLHGIVISDTEGVEVGAAGVGNVIGFNQFGIGSSSADGTNSIQGNYIGTTPLGVDVGNTGTGIYLWNSPSTLIGGVDGLESGAGNVINFNDGFGISLDDGSAPTDMTLVAGNYIGTNALDASMGNGLAGVLVRGEGFVVGAPLGETSENVARYANRIAHNAGPAVEVLTEATGATFRGNEIYQNGGGATPIDLGEDGPTQNDVGDVDGGANHLQNSPEFIVSQTVYNEVSGDLEVRYRLDTNEADAAYPLTVDFYLLNEIGGFADVYVGSDIYPVESATLYRSVAITPPAGLQMTGLLLATATDSDGNTSELSRQSVPLPEPGLALGLTVGALALASRRRPHAWKLTAR